MCNVHYTHLTALISVLPKRKQVSCNFRLTPPPLSHFYKLPFWLCLHGTDSQDRASDSVAYSILYTCTVMLSNADCIQT